jgi:hypothetical protein
VLWNFVYIYLASAMVAAAVVFAASNWVGDELRPPAHRLSLSVAAGLLWPLLLLGMIELSSVVIVTKVHHQHEPGLAIVA